jgi:hypothetical protein
MSTTITEALAELKIIGKKLENQRSAAAKYLYRPESQKDPLEKQEGSVKFVAEKRQSIADLEDRYVSIRRAIAQSNQTTLITISKDTRTISDWLVWKVAIYPERQAFLRALLGGIETARRVAQKSGGSLTTDEKTAKPTDIIVSLDEKGLLDEIEHNDTAFQTLDGQLSLKNATVVVDY